VRFISGTGVGTDSLLDLGNNSVELAGPVSSAISLQINGTPAAVLALSGSASLSGDLGVQTATVRLSPRLERAPAAITLRGGGGVQAAGDVVLPSAILVEDEGRFDSGESLLTLDGDISGSGRVLISGYSFGRVRLGGINSYSGGTSVEGTRVEVAVNAGGDNQGFSGSGRVFGSGEVSFKSASLGFVTSASVPNTLLINGELTIDVGANVGELSGFITDDVAGLGSVYITGTPKGALFLSGATNSYSGATIVEGTTLRVLNTADTSLLGTGTQPSGAPLAVQLDAATLQVVPDYNPASVAAFSPITTRDLVLGTRGATLDATDSNLVWSGVISGGDAVAGTAKLTVAGNAGTQVELTASNTYTGGTDVNGGVLVKVTSDSNLGAAGTKVTFNNGGLFYAGTGGVTFSRPIEVAGSGLIDVGSRTVTLGTLGTLSGSGVLEVGRTAYEGSTFSSTTGVLVVGDSAKGFTGRTILGGGSLLVSTSDALKNSTLEVSAGVGSVGFGSSSVNLGGLAGDMSLNFASPGILSVGLNGVNTRYAGILSGGSLTLRKVGSGNLSLGNVNAYSGPTVVDKGTLTLESGALVGSSLISMGSATSLVINGGSLDLSGKFADVEKSALVVYNGNASGVLTLPVGFAGKTLNLGQGSIKIGTAAATSGTTVAGMTVGLTSIQSIVTLNGGSVNLSSQGGAPIVLSDTASIRSQNPDDAVQIQLGEAVTMTAGLPTTSFKGYFQADGLITVAPASNSVAFELPRLKGAGKVSLTNGSTVLSASPDFKGTISLSTGASAVLTGSLDVGGSLGSVEVAAGASLSVLPEAVSQAVNVPALSGGGAISFGAGRVVLSGGNAAFTGNMTVSKGVEVTLRGDLPAGTILVSDPTVPLRVESSPSGNISLPGTVSGAGALALGGSGTFTMTGNAVIGTSQLRVGASASEKPTLDVSGLSGGVLTLSGSQTLSGGGTITGSVTTYGNFSPGNSPGTFTVATKTTNGVESGGNLTIGSGGSVTIEYGQRSGDPITFDKVDVGGTLTLEPGVKIVLRKFVDGGSWTSFVTPISLDLSSVFKANTIVIGGSYQVELEGTPLLSTVTNTSVVSSGSLSFRINKTSYAQVVGPAALQPLAGYLFSASISDPSVGLASFLSVLDASVTAGELTSYVAALQSPVYSEAQRLSLRRTAAISETLQGRLVQEAGGKAEGWSAWSETYGWSFNRDASGQVAAWQGHNFGEILGVQNTKAGLTLGLFGATGHTSSSFSSPSSTLKGDNFHGGVYAHVESGMSFFDGSFLAGRTEQKTTRTVSIGGVSGTGNAKFNTSEYAAHVRFGVVLPEVAKGLTLKPSFAVLLNGYSQGGATESGLAGVGVITEKVSDTAIQTRLGLEAGHAVKVVGKAAELSASLYWVHDADKGPRSVGTRFNGSNAPGYTAEGEAVGAEVGLGASLTLTQRTSARLNGVWQVREGSSQPGVNLGLTVRF
jgi:autotransporter-associated beta strand protein